MTDQNKAANIVQWNKPLIRRDTLESDGGGPHGPDMEARVSRLERTCADIKGALVRIEPAIVKIRDDTNEIKGKISQMPTVWTVFALVISIFGLAFVLLRYALPATGH